MYREKKIDIPTMKCDFTIIYLFKGYKGSQCVVRHRSRHPEMANLSDICVIRTFLSSAYQHMPAEKPEIKIRVNALISIQFACFWKDAR
ncbi:MAG: hypothetical protein CR984_00175 [Proteobacteria bacterium]|nr:MAG: hypothetical protein CR984_00175 [Pseudomonadota bacterium]